MLQKWPLFQQNVEITTLTHSERRWNRSRWWIINSDWRRGRSVFDASERVEHLRAMDLGRNIWWRTCWWCRWRRRSWLCRNGFIDRILKNEITNQITYTFQNRSNYLKWHIWILSLNLLLGSNWLLPTAKWQPRGLQFPCKPKYSEFQVRFETQIPLFQSKQSAVALLSTFCKVHGFKTGKFNDEGSKPSIQWSIK